MILTVKQRKTAGFSVAAAVCAMCAVLLTEKNYTLASVVIATVAVGVFMFSFEQKKISSRYAVLVAVMTALSAAGRFIFAPLPAFKPVTAMVILSGMYLSAQGGFLTGALTALISNIYFGHGAWTPFQMLAWGLIGAAAGLLSEPLKKKKLLLLAYGAFAGALYSLIADIWSVLWFGGGLDADLYKAAVISSLPFMAVYSLSNIIFLLLIGDSFGRKLGRAVTLIER